MCVVDSRGHAEPFLLFFALFLLVAFATKFFFLRTHKRQIMASQFPIYLSFFSLDSERGLIGRNNSFICSHRKGIFDTLLPPASWERPLSSASFAAAGPVASSLPSVTTSYISLPCCNSLTAVLFSGCSLRACVPLQNPPFSHSTAFLESGSLQVPVLQRSPLRGTQRFHRQGLDRKSLADLATPC